MECSADYAGWATRHLLIPPGPSLPAGTTMAASKDLAGDATSNTTEQLQASFRKVDCPGSAYHGVDVGKQGMDAAGYVQFA